MLPLLIPLAPHLVRAATAPRPQPQEQLRPSPSSQTSPTPAPPALPRLTLQLRRPPFAATLIGSRVDLLTHPPDAATLLSPGPEEFAARPVEMVGRLIGPA